VSVNLYCKLITYVKNISIAERPDIDISKIVVDEITLVGSRCGPYPAAIRLLVQQLVDVERLVTKTFPFQNAIDAFELARQNNVFKVLLEIDASRKILTRNKLIFDEN